jgi:hypothetical protein
MKQITGLGTAPRAELLLALDAGKSIVLQFIHLNQRINSALSAGDIQKRLEKF